MKILKIIFCSLVFFILLAFGFIYYSYFIAPYSHRPAYPIEKEFKTLYLESEIQEGRYFIIIDFNYTPSELSRFSQFKIDSINIYNSRQDTIEAYFTGGQWLRSIKLPMLIGDSITFPENFNIRIYNEDNTILLKYIDYHYFKKIAEANYLRNARNFLTARSYKLFINKTLLGLDQIKTDSIR